MTATNCIQKQMSWESFDIFWHHWTSLRDNFGAFSNVFQDFGTKPPLGFHGTSHVGQAVRFNTAEAPWVCRLDDVKQHILMGYVLFMFYEFLWWIWWNYLMILYIYIYSIHIDMGIVWIWNRIMCTEQMQIHWSRTILEASYHEFVSAAADGPVTEFTLLNGIYSIWNMYEYLSIYIILFIYIYMDLSIYLSIYIYIYVLYITVYIYISIYNVGSWLV